MKGISVIIPTYNSRSLLEKNLPTVIAGCSAYPGPSEILLVDDGGVEDLSVFAAPRFFGVKVLKRKKNGGFAKAANTGIRAAAYPLVFLLNDDVKVSRGVLKELVSCFSSPEVFAAQASIISSLSERSKTEIVRLSSRFGILKYEYVRENAGDNPVKTCVASGGAALFDREKLMSLGLFDEAFSPFYFEDFDVSIRAGYFNWQIFCHPKAVVFHLHSGSTVKSNYSRFRYEYLHRRNYFLLLLRYSRFYGLFFMPFYAIYRALAGGGPELLGFLSALMSRFKEFFSPGRSIPGNVLYTDSPLEPPGGGQMSLLGIVGNITTRRPFVFLSARSSIVKELCRLGIPHVTGIIERGRPFASFARVLSAIQAARPSIVHCNSAASFSTFITAVAAKLSGIPFIWHNRVVDTSGFRESLVAALSYKVIVASDAVGDKFKTLPPGKLAKIPNAVDLRAFRPLPVPDNLYSELAIARSARVIGMFSRFSKWKGHELFLAAARLILSRSPDAVILMVGEGPERTRIESLLSELKGRAVLTGHREDIPCLMSLCSVIVNPSVSPEPFGRTIIEGMACGKTVIATNAGGPLEIIEDGVDGFLVPPDAEAIADAVLKVINDPGLAERVSLAARRKAEARFGLEAHLSGLEGIYGELGAPRVRL